MPPLLIAMRSDWNGKTVDRKRRVRYPGLRDVRCAHIALPWAVIGSPRCGAADAAILMNGPSYSLKVKKVVYHEAREEHEVEAEKPRMSLKTAE